MNLILFGFKGCGKTTLGRRLALRMNRPFIDTDDLISEQTKLKLSPKEIGEQMGEAAFRKLEKEVIFSLSSIENSIIALGGGAVLDPENVEHLQKIGELIYLKVGEDTLKKRMMLENIPSFLKNTNLEVLFQERKPIYESIPARWIDIDGLEIPAALAALCSILILEEPSNGF